MTKPRRLLTALILAAAASGCTSLGSSGPRHGAVMDAQERDSRVRVVEVDDAVVRGIVAAQASGTFARTFPETRQARGVIGAGDVLDIAIWEAPPAVLFATGAAAPAMTGAPATARPSDLPGQMVDASGAITVPFAGTVRAVGRTPSDVAREIVSRLRGKAHDPQVIVRIADNLGGGVTVVGDVANSRRMPLTTRGERLLDALAAAGGVRQPVDKVLIQVTRGATVAARPLGAIIRDPAENIRLADDDVVTALHQPYSFQAMGAVGATSEVPFEGTGISLAQAVARVGGLQDNRANVKGLFVFRLEDPAALPAAIRQGAPLTPEGRVPVIYRIDMANPANFFVMQTFPMRNGDIVYVSNAPLADLQKFVGLVSQMAFSVVGVANSVD